MASFTIRSAASSGIYAKLVLTEQSQSVANNTTTLAWQLYMWNTQAKPNWYAYEEHNIVRVLINGQYVINTDDFGMISLQYEQTESSAKLISSGTITIAHNSDGTKSIKASFYVEQGWYGAYSWTGPETTISLTTIARASTPTLSASEVTLGGNVTIYTNRAAGFTHTLKYSIGSASGTIATGVTDSYTWQNIPKTLAQQFPNSPSGNVTITCETYNGSTPIGSRTAILKVLPSSDMAPTISIAVSEAGDIPSSISGYVKTKSKLYIDPSITYKYGASLKSIMITANGATYYEEPVTTGYLSTADSNTITVTVTDTRGMSKTETTSVTVADYSPPRIDSLTAYRCNASGVADVEGSHMKAVISGAITSLSGNTRTCTMYYKTADATNYSSQQSITLSSYVFSNVSSAVIGASTTNSYDVKVVIGDSFGNVAPYYATVSTASILMNILKDKSGMGIGKMAEKSGVLQLGWDLELKGDPTADNHAVSKKYVDGHDYPYMDVYTPGSYNVDECYDAGLYEIAGGANLPTGSYGSLLSLPYRKRKGNTIPDYGVHIYAPNGDNATHPNSLFYRTALKNAWNPWKEVATTDGTVANIANDTIGTDVDLLAYALTLPEHTVSARRIASGAVNIPTGQTWGTAIIQRQGGVDATIIYQSIISKGLWVNVSNSGNWSGWVRVLDTNIVSDYPVAQGTSGIWRYIKFNSGIAMCWATSGNVSSAFSSTWGSLYVHDNLFPQQTYPFSFTDYPRVFASPFGLNGNTYTTGDYWIYSGTLGSPSISPAFSAARPTKPSATITICASILAIGMWR